MELTFISSTPGEVSEEEALDAYSLAVTTVAERLFVSRDVSAVDASSTEAAAVW